jgi:signal transduction histidine kinase
VKDGTTAPTTPDTRLPEVVAIACHDLRTPLATIHGFARTLARTELPGPGARYVEMIEMASVQLAELLDELSLVARIESGRYQPTVQDLDSFALARAAAAELEEGAVSLTGEGAPVRVDFDSTRRALRQLARAARRHGGLDTVDLDVRGTELEVGPITPSSAKVVTGEDLRELAAPAAVATVRAQGGSVELEGETLRIGLPAGT